MIFTSFLPLCKGKYSRSPKTECQTWILCYIKILQSNHQDFLGPNWHRFDISFSRHGLQYQYHILWKIALSWPSVHFLWFWAPNAIFCTRCHEWILCKKPYVQPKFSIFWKWFWYTSKLFRKLFWTSWDHLVAQKVDICAILAS